MSRRNARLREPFSAVLGKRAASASRDVVKATVYLKDIGDFAAVNEIYGRYLAPEGVIPPARTTVEIARLPKDALIEIDLIARVP